MKRFLCGLLAIGMGFIPASAFAQSPSGQPPAGWISIGQGAALPLWKAITGDISIALSGVTTIANGAVTAAKLASGAAASNIGTLTGALAGSTLPATAIANNYITNGMLNGLTAWTNDSNGIHYSSGHAAIGANASATDTFDFTESTTLRIVLGDPTRSYIGTAGNYPLQLATNNGTPGVSGYQGIQIGANGVVQFPNLSGGSGCLNVDGFGNLQPTTTCSADAGIPTGGAPGQALLKYDNTNGHTNWYTPETFNISTDPTVDCLGVSASDTPFNSAFTNHNEVLIPSGCNILLSNNNSAVSNGKILTIANGGQLNVANTKTATIAGTINAGAYKIFYGAGSVVGMSSVVPEWWGITLGSTSCGTPCVPTVNTASINSAIAAVQASSGSDGYEKRIRFACGSYAINGTITFTISSAIPWRIGGCGSVGSFPTTFLTVASFSGSIGVLITSSGSVTGDWSLTGLAVLNQTAASGPTAGIQIGSSGNNLVGTQASAVEDVYSSGFALDWLIENVRLVVFRRVSGWSGDSAGVQTNNSVPFTINVSASPGFTGDMDFYNSQCVAPIITSASFTGTGSGTNLTASAVSGVISPAAAVTGTGVPGSTTITSQTSGTPGGAGVYVTNNATTSSGDPLVAATSPSGTCFNIANATNSTNISGVRLHSFIFYGGTTQLALTATNGGAIPDVWEDSGSQHEGPAPGTSVAVQLTATASTIRNFHIDHSYLSGSGFNKHIVGSTPSGGVLSDVFVTNNFIADPMCESIDIRGTGGAQRGVTIANNEVYDPGSGTVGGGCTNANVFYFETANQVTLTGNSLVNTSGGRTNFIFFNTGGDYFTAVGNNGGGLITTPVVNSAGAAHTQFGFNQ